MALKVILLDFDGVLVESNAIKDQAFEYVFAEYSQHLPDILAYHRQTSVIRFEKFRFIYDHILHQPYTAEEGVRLGQKFSQFCVDQVIQCPAVDGAHEFLEFFHGKIPMYLISINPPEDLTTILKTRGMRKFFRDVYAVEGEKFSAINAVLAREHVRSDEAVFVGDSREDLQSAQVAQVPFIARQAQGKLPDGDFQIFMNMRDILNHLCKRL